MSQPATTQGAKTASNTWMSWLTIAAVAIVLGLVAPQLLPGESTSEKSESKAEVKEKGKLEYTAPAVPEPPSIQSMLVRLGAGTAVVLGLCVATMWGMRRWLHPTAANSTGPKALRLKESLHLGSRCCLHLVQMDKQSILIGVDATGIKTIVPLTAAFEDVLDEADAPPALDEPITGPKLAA